MGMAGVAEEGGGRFTPFEVEWLVEVNGEVLGEFGVVLASHIAAQPVDIRIAPVGAMRDEPLVAVACGIEERPARSESFGQAQELLVIIVVDVEIIT